MLIDVRHIAKLAHLRLEEGDAARFQKEMEDILHLVDSLPQTDGELAALDPNAAMRLREDEVRPSLRRDLLLANAPQVKAGCVVVPKTVE